MRQQRLIVPSSLMRLAVGLLVLALSPVARASESDKTVRCTASDSESLDKDAQKAARTAVETAGTEAALAEFDSLESMPRLEAQCFRARILAKLGRLNEIDFDTCADQCLFVVVDLKSAREQAKRHAVTVTLAPGVLKVARVTKSGPFVVYSRQTAGTEAVISLHFPTGQQRLRYWVDGAASSEETADFDPQTTDRLELPPAKPATEPAVTPVVTLETAKHASNEGTATQPTREDTTTPPKDERTPKTSTTVVPPPAKRTWGASAGVTVPLQSNFGVAPMAGAFYRVKRVIDLTTNVLFTATNLELEAGVGWLPLFDALGPYANLAATYPYTDKGRRLDPSEVVRFGYEAGIRAVVPSWVSESASLWANLGWQQFPRQAQAYASGFVVFGVGARL